VVQISIVGPQASGKSSLRTWFTDHNTRTIKREELQYMAPTLGLEIQNHRLLLVPPDHLRTTKIRSTLEATNLEIPSDLKPIAAQETFCSVWDFSGNHTYRFMHQYFLSPFIGGVCILTFNLAQWYEQQDDVLQWLKFIEARAKGTAIVIVATHVDKVYRPTCACITD
jgi:hypothetical protein